MSSWGWGTKFQKSSQYVTFLFLVSKVDGYQVQKKFVNDFLKSCLKTWVFIPRREMRSISSRGQLFLLMFYFGLGKVYWISKIIRVYRDFFARKCFIWWDGRTDGLDGLDGPEKCPLNFFIISGYLDYVYIYLYTK